MNKNFQKSEGRPTKKRKKEFPREILVYKLLIIRILGGFGFFQDQAEKPRRVLSAYNERSTPVAYFGSFGPVLMRHASKNR